MLETFVLIAAQGRLYKNSKQTKSFTEYKPHKLFFFINVRPGYLVGLKCFNYVGLNYLIQIHI